MTFNKEPLLAKQYIYNLISEKGPLLKHILVMNSCIYSPTVCIQNLFIEMF